MGDPDRRYKQILLASEGRPFSDEAIARWLAIAAPGANVRVFSVARIHGVAFGMPNPGLLPTKAEWAEQRELAAKAIKRLKRRRLSRRRARGGHPQRDQDDPQGGDGARV